jgi:hypothetical protein
MNKSLLKTLAGFAAFGGAMISMDSARAQLPPPQHYLVIGALEFHPYDTFDSARDCNGNGTYCSLDASASSGTLAAALPAAIPDAAVLRALTCIVYDNSTTQNVTARLVQHSWSTAGPTSTVINAVSSGSASTTYQGLGSLGSNEGNIVLDRHNYSYSIFIDMPVTGSSMRIQSCRAQYDG